MKNKKVKIFVVCIGILMAGVAYIFGCGLTDSGSNAAFQLEETSETTESTINQSGQKESTTSGGEVEETEAAAEVLGIFIHVCGEVERPGVYEMKPGNRVFEAVEEAGGFTDKAASDYLNLAQPLTDGMKITVPDKEQAKTLSEADQQLVSDGGSMPADEEKININTATKEQLMTLRGVGEARAADIIAYRQQNGSFKKIEDIMEVSGIKEAAFQKIKESITV